jgi:hypothetical protein
MEVIGVRNISRLQKRLLLRYRHNSLFLFAYLDLWGACPKVPKYYPVGGGKKSGKPLKTPGFGLDQD